MRPDNIKPQTNFQPGQAPLGEVPPQASTQTAPQVPPAPDQNQLPASPQSPQTFQPFAATPQTTYGQPSTDMGSSYAPMPPGKPKSRKKLVILAGSIAGALLIVGVGGTILFSAINSGGDGESVISGIQTALSGDTADVINRPDGTLVLRPAIDAQESIKAQDLSATLNQQVNLSDGLSFMVTDVTVMDKYEKTMLGDPTTETPDSGNEFIKVTYVVGNRLESEEISYSVSTFEVMSPDAETKYTYEFFLSSDPLMPKDYYSVKSPALMGGQQQTFVAYYEVPKTGSLVTQVERQYSSYSSDEEVTIVGKVKLR